MRSITVALASVLLLIGAALIPDAGAAMAAGGSVVVVDGSARNARPQDIRKIAALLREEFGANATWIRLRELSHNRSRTTYCGRVRASRHPKDPDSFQRFIAKLDSGSISLLPPALSAKMAARFRRIIRSACPG